VPYHSRRIEEPRLHPKRLIAIQIGLSIKSGSKTRRRLSHRQGSALAEAGV